MKLKSCFVSKVTFTLREHDTRQAQHNRFSARPESCRTTYYLPVKFKFKPTDEIPPSFAVYHKSRNVCKNFVLISCSLCCSVIFSISGIMKY